MDSKDLAMHQALMRLLDEGVFELKGSSVPRFLLVKEWARQLADRKEVETKKKKAKK